MVCTIGALAKYMMGVRTRVYVSMPRKAQD